MTQLTGKERAEYVQGMFTKIARRYDLMNRIMTGGQDVRWRKRVIELARLRSNSSVLDLGTGTGHLAREALSHHGDIRALFPGIRGAARTDHGTRLPGRGRADHRADVSALHIFYDHRSEDDGETEMGAVPGRVPGGCDGDGPAIGRKHSRAVLRFDDCRPRRARV